MFDDTTVFTGLDVHKAQAPQAFRGIQKTVACTVVAETHDLSRFARPTHFMAWLGLVPGEHSSGATRRQGPITRCGNHWARTLLVEAAWSYRHQPKVSRIIEARAGDIDPAIRAIAWRAQIRLHHVFSKLVGRGKHRNVAPPPWPANSLPSSGLPRVNSRRIDGSGSTVVRPGDGGNPRRR